MFLPYVFSMSPHPILIPARPFASASCSACSPRLQISPRRLMLPIPQFPSVSFIILNLDHRNGPTSDAIQLINRHPTKTLQHHTPFFALYGVHPSYSHLRVFSCKCYPNLSATTSHKLAPRSVMCIFLGYPRNHKGYRCYDPESKRVYISRHVVFDEHCFPYADLSTHINANDLDFLEDFDATAPAPIGRASSVRAALSTPQQTAGPA